MRTNPRPPRSGVCRGGVKAPLRALFTGAGAWAVWVLLEVLLDLMAAMVLVLVAVAVLVYNSPSTDLSSGSTPTLPNATADARRMASTSAGPSVGPSAGPSAGGRAAAGRGMASVTGTTAPAGAAGPGNMSKEEWAEHWRMAIRRFRQEEAALEARGGGSGAEKGRR